MAATRGVYKRFGITEKMLWTHSVSAAIGTKAFVRASLGAAGAVTMLSFAMLFHGV